LDPLSDTLAQVGVPFHETLLEKTGKQLLVDGYFTGLAENNGAGWQFRSAHWVGTARYNGAKVRNGVRRHSTQSPESLT